MAVVLEQPAHRANGFALPRTLHMGATPTHIRIQRARPSFYPALLGKYQRYLPRPDDHLFQTILPGPTAPKPPALPCRLRLSYAPEQLETTLVQVHNQAETLFFRPLRSDWLFVFAEAKIEQLVDARDELKTAEHLSVIGVALSGLLELLTMAVS